MDFPCELLIIEGHQALEKYKSLRKQRGIYPVIVGDQDDVELISENLDMANDTFDELIEKAIMINPQKWFEERAASDPEFYAMELGYWPSVCEPNDRFVAHMDVMNGTPKDEVYIALVPVEHSWLTPAFLGIGGWNECPLPEEHAAVFRYWHTKYDANVVTIANDIIEFKVGKPPQTKEESMFLAKQQFVYCADLVHQGTQTISALAATLLHANVWYFWWD